MQTDRLENNVKETKKERRKKATKKAVPNIVIALIVAAVVTFLFWFKSSSILLNGLTGWTLAGCLAAVFSFAFGFVMIPSYWKKLKEKSNFTKQTLFIILSVAMTSIAVWASKDNYHSFAEGALAWAIGTGCCYALFTIFSRFDYSKIEKNALDFVMGFLYKVLIPCMFLIIVLIGKIDTQGTFLPKAKAAMNVAGVAIANAASKLIEIIYNLGKYKYSGMFILAVFVFLIFFWMYKFLKGAIKLTPLKSIPKPSLKSLVNEIKEHE